MAVYIHKKLLGCHKRGGQCIAYGPLPFYVNTSSSEVALLSLSLSSEEPRIQPQATPWLANRTEVPQTGSYASVSHQSHGNPADCKVTRNQVQPFVLFLFTACTFLIYCHGWHSFPSWGGRGVKKGRLPVLVEHLFFVNTHHYKGKLRCKQCQNRGTRIVPYTLYPSYLFSFIFAILSGRGCRRSISVNSLIAQKSGPLQFGYSSYVHLSSWIKECKNRLFGWITDRTYISVVGLQIARTTLQLAYRSRVYALQENTGDFYVTHFDIRRRQKNKIHDKKKIHDNTVPLMFL